MRLCSQVSSRQFVVFTDYLDAYTRDVSESYTELDDGSWDEYENGAFVVVGSVKEPDSRYELLIGCVDSKMSTRHIPPKFAV